MRFSIPKLKIKNPLAEESPEDRSIFAICIGIAFFFWLLVKLSDEYTVVREAHISYDLPLGKAFATAPPELLNVNLKSQGWNFFLTGITGKRYELHCDVLDRSTFELTTFELNSKLEAAINDKDVFITNLNFRGFNSALEEQQQRKLPIIVNSRLAFAEEYDLAGAVVAKPDSVVIVGPISQLEGLSYWSTDSLLLDNLSETHIDELRLRIPDDGLQIEFEAIEVTVPVERYTEKSIFVPITLLNPSGDSIRIFPDKALVKCVLGLGNYNRLSAIDFELVADLSQNVISAGKNTVPLELKSQPDYLRNVILSPRSVEFFLIQNTEEE